MQTELPTMLNVFQDDYQLEYSESYSGTVHRETIREGYQYCTSLQRAFESLISDGHTNFILTVGVISVDFTMSISWRLQLDMPGETPKFTQICVLLLLTFANCCGPLIEINIGQTCLK